LTPAHLDVMNKIIEKQPQRNVCFFINVHIFKNFFNYGLFWLLFDCLDWSLSFLNISYSSKYKKTNLLFDSSNNTPHFLFVYIMQFHILIIFICDFWSVCQLLFLWVQRW
jgi:hypothetical protein